MLDGEIRSGERHGIAQFQNRPIHHSPQRLNVVERECRIGAATGTVVTRDTNRRIVSICDELNLGSRGSPLLATESA